MRLTARLTAPLAALFLSPSALLSQTYNISPLDGTTPGINTPGSPDGAFRLSSLDTVNHANGHLNISIPVAEALGRGDAKAPVIVPVQSHWHVQTININYCPGGTNCQEYTGFLPLNESWSIDEPNFVQGAMQIRTSGDSCVQGTSGNTATSQWLHTLTRLTYTGPDGTEHDFRDQKTGGLPEQIIYGFTFDRGSVFQAFDGSDAVFTSSSDLIETAANPQNPNVCNAGASNYNGSVGANGTLRLKNGTTYTVVSNYVTKIEDRNGNYLEFDNQYGTYPLIFNDELGRTLTIESYVPEPNATSQTIYYPYPVPNSSNRQITLTYQPLDSFIDVTTNQNVAPQSTSTLFPTIPYCIGSGCQVGGSGPSVPPATTYNPQSLLAAVTYPDNSVLSFSYDVYGNVSKILLPTGGMFVYKYGATVNQLSLRYTSNCVGSGGTCPSGFVIEEYVTEKDIYVTAPTSWPFPQPDQRIFFCPLSGTTPGGVAYFAQAGRVVYTDGAGTYNCNSGVGTNIQGIEDHFTYPVNPNPPFLNTYYRGWQEGKEFQTNLYDTNTALLQQSVSTWQQRDCNTETTCWFGSPYNTISSAYAYSPVVPEHDPMVITKTVTLGSGSASVTSQEQYTYDECNNETLRQEYGYGSLGGGPSSSSYRTTQTHYYYHNNTYPNCTQETLLDLPSQVQTFDSGNNLVAETDYCYDWASCICYQGSTRVACSATQTIAPESNITKHDDTNYPPSVTARGNPTVINRLLNDMVNNYSSYNLTTQYSYDVAGNVVTQIDPRCVRRDYGYADASGNNSYAFPTSVSSYTGLCGAGTKLTASATYNYSIGKAASTTDVNGNPTSYSYVDPFDRLTLISRPDNGSTSIAYKDTVGSFSVQSNVAQSSGPPIATKVSYDGLGRKTCSQDVNASIYTTYSYDGRGRLSCTSLPFAQTQGTCSSGCNSSNGTVTAFDGMNRSTTVTDVGNAVTHITYGASTTAAGIPSFQTVTQDPANFWKRSSADAFGRLLEVQENPTSGAGLGSIGNGSMPTYTTVYGYDALDDLTSASQTDPTSLTQISRTFTYDSVKRLVKAINPESGTIQYTYDASGNLSVRNDSVRTLTFTPAYDGMNRPTGKSYNDSITPTVTYGYCDSAGNCTGGYNELGRLTSVSTAAILTRPATTNSYSRFDAMGRVLNSSQQIGSGSPYTFAYLYDISGALASITYPSLRTVTNTFDSSGRVSSVIGTKSGANSPYVTGVQYAPQGAVSGLTMNNGLTEGWVFNARQQPTNLTVTGGGTQLMNLTWGYGTNLSQYDPTTNNGDVTSHKIQRFSGLGSPSTVLTQNFSYADPANRLSSAVEVGSWSQGYVYDAFGNRMVTSSSYLPNQGFTPVQGTPAGSQFTNNQWIRGSGDSYDGAGNQKSLAQYNAWTTQGSTFTYDGENRLLAANVAQNAGVASFVYDGEGRRVQKVSGSGSNAVTTTFIHDAMGQLAAEYSTAADPISGTQYLSADHLGSTRLVTDQMGVPARAIDYLPFGEEIPSGMDGRTAPYDSLGSPAQYPTTPDVVNEKFTGKERDAETGLDYFGARYFSGAQGRFTTVDTGTKGLVPSVPQTWNKYAYAVNNPLAYVDVNGEWPFYVHEDMLDIAFGRVLPGSELKWLKHVNWLMDFGPGQQDKEHSNQHSMCVPGQSTPSCLAGIEGVLSTNMVLAQGKSRRFALSLAGEDIHTIQDWSSPAHVGDDGIPYTWDAPPLLSAESRAHFLAESDFSVNPQRFYLGVRLSVAMYLAFFPDEKDKFKNLESWIWQDSLDKAAQQIGTGSGDPFRSHMDEGMLAQCYAGNPAACNH